MVDIKKFRQINKITQSELAEYLGVNIMLISRVENKKTTLPTIKMDMLLNNPYNWDISPLDNYKQEQLPNKTKGDRLNIFIRYLLINRIILTRNEFSVRTSINPTQVSEMIKNKASVTDRTIDKIKNAFQYLNKEWLKEGRGDMLLTKPQPLLEKDNSEMPDKIKALEDIIKQKDILIEQQQKMIDSLLKR